ncbi:MAG: type VI secretion system lipoprotein TssJ [Pseudomonadota bacterium]
MKHFKIVCYLIVVLLISACAATRSVKKEAIKPPPMEVGFEENAIRLHLKGDPQLNLYQKKPHALVICVYQLRDPNAFGQVADEKEGIQRLMECTRFDPGVVCTKRIVIQPGQEIEESIDRAEGTRYVGIVAGYFGYEQKNVMRLMSIPAETSLILRRKSAAPLDIKLYLGPTEMRDLKEEEGK